MVGFILSLFGCSNVRDPVFTVSGKVINENGNGVPCMKVFISCSNEPYTAGADGSFADIGVPAPNDLRMVSGNFGYQYIGFTTFTPQLLEI